MASVRLWSERSGFEPWPGTCVVFLGKTLNSHGASLTQVYKWVPANLMLEVTLRWSCNPSMGEKKYPHSLHVTETRISSCLMGHLARMQTLPHDKTYFNRVINSYSEILSEKENTITFLQTRKISGHRFGSHFVQFRILMVPSRYTLLAELPPNKTFITPRLIDCLDK